MILRWIIVIILIYLLFKLIRKGFPEVGGRSGPTRIKPPVTGEELVEDPLCHTYVPISQAFRTEIEGRTVYFCSQKCLKQYGRK